MKSFLFAATSLAALSPLAFADTPAMAPDLPPPPDQGGMPSDHGHPRHAMQDVAFIGVSTAPMPPALADQLSLPKDEGLVVVEVVRNAPAKDSLKTHDVLVKLDDQILIDSRQFGVLVRSHKAGDVITLSYIRQGKPAEAKVTLGQHSIPMDMDMYGPRGDVRHLKMLTDGDGSHLRRLDEMGPPPSPMGGPGQELVIERRREDDHGDPSLDAAVHAVKWDTTNGTLVFTDEAGTMHLVIKDGKQTLKATDAKGASLFDGPVDTPEQRASMSPEVTARFDKLEHSLHGGKLGPRNGDGPSDLPPRPDASGMHPPAPSAE